MSGWFGVVVTWAGGDGGVGVSATWAGGDGVSMDGCGVAWDLQHLARYDLALWCTVVLVNGVQVW